MEQALQSTLLMLLNLLIYSTDQLQRQNATLCPAACLCKKNKTVECASKLLKTIPRNLPKSTVYLDLSNNEIIRIPETFFIKFVNLKHLNVRRCDIESHFIIPKKLMTIKIRHNKLSFKGFRLMFSNSSSFLRIIDAGNNKIVINTRGSLFEKAVSLRNLDLSRNIMPIVYQDTFKRLHKLHVLVIAKMEVKTIEDDAFEDLVQLSQLDLRDHKLISLPQTFSSQWVN